MFKFQRMFLWSDMKLEPKGAHMAYNKAIKDMYDDQNQGNDNERRLYTMDQLLVIFFCFSDGLIDETTPR